MQVSFCDDCGGDGRVKYRSIEGEILETVWSCSWCPNVWVIYTLEVTDVSAFKN